jgi:hypothetical protein
MNIAFEVCLHLDRNPGAALFTADIARLFNVERSQDIVGRLESATRNGWLTREKSGRLLYYSAGPKLIEKGRR